MMNTNIFQMLGSNPQAAAMQMLQQQSKTNPMMQNVLNMVNSNNAKGVENIARNVCREKGIDPDAMFNQIKNQYSR